ncbi:apolipoprotein D-like [Tetranychus urticae]|uniref:Apolipoprotein D n=1 Tax=Tetranychus urticae TaxID=32264 RepID=T1JR61_TETUR|nr:apolipoprotein D-like [Tetranychus urticae]
MNQLALISLIVLSSTLSVYAYPQLGSSLSPGRCPQTTEIEGGFNLTQYLGKWYEIKRTGLVFEFGQRCVKAEYKLDSDGNVAVNNSGVNLVNFEVYSVGTAKPGTQSNVFAVTFFPLSPSSQYWIVDTDYETYSLVVSCNDVLGLFNLKDAWILSRKPKLDEEIVKRLVDKLGKLGVPSSLLSTTTQNCDK